MLAALQAAQTPFCLSRKSPYTWFGKTPEYPRSSGALLHEGLPYNARQGPEKLNPAKSSSAQERLLNLGAVLEFWEHLRLDYACVGLGTSLRFLGPSSWTVLGLQGFRVLGLRAVLGFGFRLWGSMRAESIAWNGSLLFAPYPRKVCHSLSRA